MDLNTPSTAPSLPPLGSGIGAVETGPAAMPTTPVIPADIPHSPKRRFNWRILGAVVALFVLLGGSAAGYFLTQQNQDVRQQASTVSTCKYVSRGDWIFRPAGTPYMNLEGTQRGICNGQGEPIIQEIMCGACNNGWFSAKYTCNDIKNKYNCQNPSDEDDDETSPGDDGDIDKGGEGQPCRDPKDARVCDGNLYCNTDTGLCQASIPGNICSGKTGSGGTLNPNKCIVCDCGNSCNMTNECTLNCKVVEGAEKCEDATQKLLSSDKCGQVDFVNGSDVYCGTKAVKCDGTCAPPNPPNPPTDPAAIQCKEVVGKVGEPRSGTAVAVAPRIGDDFFLKCRKVAGASSYRFRYFYTKRKGAEAYTSIASKKPVKVGRHPEFPHYSQNIQVQQVGFFYGQCRVCMPDASNHKGERCGKWESVTNSAPRLPFQDMPPLNTTIDSDDGIPVQAVPAPRKFEEYYGGPQGTPQIDSTTPGSGDNVIDPVTGPPVGTQ